MSILLQAVTCQKNNKLYVTNTMFDNIIPTEEDIIVYQEEHYRAALTSLTSTDLTKLQKYSFKKMVRVFDIVNANLFVIFLFRPIYQYKLNILKLKIKIYKLIANLIIR